MFSCHRQVGLTPPYVLGPAAPLIASAARIGAALAG